jgi:hypothetical protein
MKYVQNMFQSLMLPPLLQMKGLMTLLAVHTMLLQKSCIDHIVQKQTCGVLVLSLIYYFVVADHSGHELNQEFFAQC